jgi:hypothetical protein
MAVRNGSRPDNESRTTPGPHTGGAFSDIYGVDDHAAMRDCASLTPLEDYTNKYKVRVLERLCSAL